MINEMIHFTKMHGCGNDYIYIDTTLYNIDNPEKTSVSLSRLHTGVGADGLVLIGVSPVPEADFSMRIFNADGSEAMMCGNAARCIGKYVYEKGLTTKTTVRLLTLSGVKTLSLHLAYVGDTRKAGVVESVTVDMGQPVMADRRLVCVGDGAMKEQTLGAMDKVFRGTFVSMGNPHCVIFTDDVEQLPLNRYGAFLECHPYFPERCNIEFAQVLDDGRIRVRVWERGSGTTMACGTGACATAVAACVTGRGGRANRVVMDGGMLDVEWNEQDDHVYLTGPAEFVFEGEIEAPLTPIGGK